MFEISKQFIKGCIVCKQMQSFGDGQAVTGPDQDSVRFSEFFRNRVPINHIRSLLFYFMVAAMDLPEGS